MDINIQLKRKYLIKIINDYNVRKQYWKRYKVPFLTLLLLPILKIFDFDYYLISKNYVEIELTSFCNLKCFQCNRSCGQAPTRSYITVDQIKKFIAESIKYKKKWKRIRILGGEPTLHPQFYDCLDLLLEYRDRYSRHTALDLFSNGYGAIVRKKLKKISKDITVYNENKTSRIQKDFSNYNYAPIDIDSFKNSDFSRGCKVLGHCGTAFTPYGFYACGPGASIDRVFGFGIGIRNLSSMKLLALRKQLFTLCRYCGHYLDWGPRKRRNKHHVSNNNEMSDSWIKAYNKYKKTRPKLTLY